MKQFIPFLLLFLTSSLLFSCHKDDSADDVPAAADSTRARTVLVYMVAQNTLGGDGYHKADSLEMLAARRFIPKGGRLLVFVDAGSGPRVYDVQRKGFVEVKRWDYDFCSASPERFREVLEWMRTEYAADDYGLVLWSHSDGWIEPTDTAYSKYESQSARRATPFSYGIDSGPKGGFSNRGARMAIPDLAAAIEAAGLHFSYIFFDSCLMQCIEVDYALRGVTDYVIASPMSISASGSHYGDDIRFGFYTDDPNDLARIYLADVKADSLDTTYGSYGIVLSCVRTDRLEALADALADALPSSTLLNFYTQGTDPFDADSVLNYYAYCHNYYYRPHYFEMLQVLRASLPTLQYEAVRARLDEAVTFHGATQSFYIGPGIWTYKAMPLATDDYRGVSMFAPMAVYTTNASISAYGDLNEAWRRTEWYQRIAR